jgi:hypothetical protein
VAQNIANRRSAIDGRTTWHPGYAVSQRIRKRIEEAFGWIKTSGGLRKTRHRGKARVGWTFALTAAACNLIRLPKLLAAEWACSPSAGRRRTGPDGRTSGQPNPPRFSLSNKSGGHTRINHPIPQLVSSKPLTRRGGDCADPQIEA